VAKLTAIKEHALTAIKKLALFITFAVFVSGVVMLAARAYNLYQDRSHTEETQVTGMNGWLPGEIRVCKLGRYLYCGQGDVWDQVNAESTDAHTFSVQFDKALAKPTGGNRVGWKCTRYTNSISCEAAL
jgi:hypothetical protein